MELVEDIQSTFQPYLSVFFEVSSVAIVLWAYALIAY